MNQLYSGIGVAKVDNEYDWIAGSCSGSSYVDCSSGSPMRKLTAPNPRPAPSVIDPTILQRVHFSATMAVAIRTSGKSSSIGTRDISGMLPLKGVHPSMSALGGRSPQSQVSIIAVSRLKADTEGLATVERDTTGYKSLGKGTPDHSKWRGNDQVFHIGPR
jgi:hypothetical protein